MTTEPGDYRSAQEDEEEKWVRLCAIVVRVSRTHPEDAQLLQQELGLPKGILQVIPYLLEAKKS